MEPAVKDELHQLIEKCDNQILLSEVKEILLSNSLEDWWDELTEEDKKLLMESEQQYNQGKVVSNTELMKQFDEWKRNSLDQNYRKVFLGNSFLPQNKLAAFCLK